MPVCPKCRAEKDVSEFHRSVSSKRGHVSRCRQCTSEDHALLWRQRNPPDSEVGPDEKRCPGCGEVKKKAEFYPSKTHASGLKSRCRVCTRQDRREQYAADPEFFKNKEAERRRLGLCKKKTPQQNRENWCKTKYGITSETYDAMFAAQDGRCAICRDEKSTEVLNVDHDHKTNAVRDLLCGPCNRGLGHFRDSTERLTLAIAYLKRHAGG